MRGFSWISALQQICGKIKLHHRIVRRKLDGDCEMIRRFVRISAFQQIHSQIELRHRIIRLDADGIGVKLFRVVIFADVFQRFAEAIFCGVIVRGRFDRV